MNPQTMAYAKRLGIFVRTPRPGQVKSRLVPPLTEDEACGLYRAFLQDLFLRLEKLKKVSATVFFADGDPEPIGELAPARFRLVAQEGADLGERLQSAFRRLLAEEGEGMALVIGSDSPDLPLAFLKRGFVKLKHRDVVLGPASDGGYYLIGLKRWVPQLFEGVSWGTSRVLEETLERVRRLSLTCSLLPLWYDVDDALTLRLLNSMVLGKRMERGDRLRNTERILRKIRSAGH